MSTVRSRTIPRLLTEWSFLGPAVLFTHYSSDLVGHRLFRLGLSVLGDPHTPFLPFQLNGTYLFTPLYDVLSSITIRGFNGTHLHGRTDTINKIVRSFLGE